MEKYHTGLKTCAYCPLLGHLHRGCVHIDRNSSVTPDEEKQSNQRESEGGLADDLFQSSVIINPVDQEPLSSGTVYQAPLPAEPVLNGFKVVEGVKIVKFPVSVVPSDAEMKRRDREARELWSPPWDGRRGF